MAEQRNGENGIEVLRRMICYVREEAIRLRIADVALLLEHAEEAVTAFAPATLEDGATGASARFEAHIEH